MGRHDFDFEGVFFAGSYGMEYPLSESDIAQSDDAYGMVVDYFHEMRIRGDHPLPTVGSDLLLFFDIDSEYHNGGLWQYFSNLMDDSGVLNDEVRRLPVFLEVVGANDMGTLIVRATDCWLELVEQRRNDEVEGTGDATQRFFESGEQVIGELDEQFGAIYESTTRVISEYVRRHAGDFCASD